MLRDENEANVRCRETAVVKKEDSRLAENDGAGEGKGGLAGVRTGRSGREPSRFLKQQIIFPIYEDAHAKRLGEGVQDERGKLPRGTTRGKGGKEAEKERKRERNAEG